MVRRYLNVEKHGFYGAYYENPRKTDKAIIAMIGDSIDDAMVRAAVRWMFSKGCNVLAMTSESSDYAFHDYKIEYFERAVRYLKFKGNKKFGICGASTTGMAALAAASFVPDITLTIALSPSDFIMEGFYRDGLDGARERPGNDESTLSYHGKSLPYLPFAYRHPEYWQQIMAEAKRRGDMIASRDLFDRSEELCPLTEDMMIKTENIKGVVVCVGAEDDSLWDTCRYIRRIGERLAQKKGSCEFHALTYKYGSHLVFPQSMLDDLIPVANTTLLKFAFRTLREHPRACRATRMDVDYQLTKIINDWRKDV